MSMMSRERRIEEDIMEMVIEMSLVMWWLLV